MNVSNIIIFNNRPNFPLYTADIGGFLGLCLGGSLLTLVELMDIISSIIYKVCTHGMQDI